MKTWLAVLTFLLCVIQGNTQCNISGEVRDLENHQIPFGLVMWIKSSEGNQADENGKFRLPCSDRNDDTLLIQSIGYKDVRIPRREITTDQTFVVRMELVPNDLETMVISANREAIRLRDAPVLIDVIDRRLFDVTQSVSLSEGLKFSPGLRVENNCQNCGFSSVRMNGLPGAYAQILINSRPVYSALSSVYGLEQIPPAMIDRVEVMRGGGSVLFGGNAIAGTINIITKDPIENGWSAGSTYALTHFSKPDYYGYLNGSVVSKSMKSGISGFVSRRDRTAWDASNDGFSEIPILKNFVSGLNMFHLPSENSRLAASIRLIDDQRRGGSELNLKPHESRIAEMANHRVIGADLSYEINSKNDAWKTAIYGSSQLTHRDSYYGSSLSSFPEKQYGEARDVVHASGVQFSFRWPKLRSVLMLGTEYLNNRILDDYPGFMRQINQHVATSGNYFQWQLDLHRKWMINAGVRYDHVKIDGLYDFEGNILKNDKTLQVPNLRFTSKFKARSNWDLRLNLASGYRAPQAFDEDLHIDVVGGNPRFVKLSENLKPERSLSGSFTSDVDLKRPKGNWELVQEFFITQLMRPFILADLQTTSSGVLVVEKRNGEGAQVAGINLEFKYQNRKNGSLEFGFTWQHALYFNEEILWESGSTVVSTRKILRTPNLYGFLSGSFNQGKKSAFNYSAVFTGKMLVPHVKDAQTGFQEIVETPVFIDLGLKYSYTWIEKKKFYFITEIGIQNILNSYQWDFDNGIGRDAAYVYGPMRPATLMLSFKLGSNKP
jgi:outer membrane receptor for ferrienterochelin and colicins